MFFCDIIYFKIGQKMKIFVSHHHEYKEKAGKIKSYLEREYGLSVFLAHEDIEPTADWEKVIIRELESCDVFIALLTEMFKLSDWTSQEVGFVLGRKIYIIPVKISQDPYGFISRIQAFKIDDQNLYESCKKIAQLISLRDDLKEDFLNSLISVFKDSDCFDRAKVTIDLLLDYKDEYSLLQMNEIISIASENPQIYGCFKAVRKLKEFVKANESELDPSIVSEFMGKAKES